MKCTLHQISISKTGFLQISLAMKIECLINWNLQNPFYIATITASVAV